jgi:hypothetical protein
VTIALLTALVLIAGAFLVVLDRRDKRGFDERQAEREVMDRLLQRIQAPEIAVAQAAAVGAVDMPAVNPELDDDYWEARDDALRQIDAIERGEA